MLTLVVVIYHMSTPHHPKFYITCANRTALICHIIGGTSAILGLYVGMLINSKMIVLIGAALGLVLHWPSSVW